jgi:hypothetical protein
MCVYLHMNLNHSFHPPIKGDCHINFLKHIAIRFIGAVEVSLLYERDNSGGIKKRYCVGEV